MRRPTRFLTFLPALVLALGTVFVLGACDTNTEADENDFAVFQQGTWRVSSFRVDGTELVDRVNDQFDSPVRITLFTEDDSDERRFEIFARVDGQAENFDVDGDIDIDGDDDNMDFFPDLSGFDNFEVAYQIQSDTRVILTTNDRRDGEALRNILLPDSEIGGDDPDVRIVITR